MAQIIYVFERFTSEEKKDLSHLLQDTPFELRDAASLAPSEKKEIVVMLGLDQSLLKEILQMEKPALKFLQVISTGIDYLPLKKLAEKGVLLANGHGLQKNSVTEHVLGVLLAYQRKLLTSAFQQQVKIWQRPAGTLTTFAHKKILITGTGIISQHLAKTLDCLGATLSGVNTTGHPVTYFHQTFSLTQLKTAVSTQDIVINLLPSTRKTEKVFNTEIFSAMKKGCVFVNVGRGSGVVIEDLIAALNQNQLDFAALDVFDEEPLPENSKLWHHPKILVTPHIAGFSDNLNECFYYLAKENLISFLKDQRPKENLISYEKGY